MNDSCMTRDVAHFLPMLFVLPLVTSLVENIEKETCLLLGKSNTIRRERVYKMIHALFSSLCWCSLSRAVSLY